MERRNRKHALERVRVVVNTGADSLVQQQFKDEVDINTIVRRFGMSTTPVYVPGVYGDFTGIVDFESASLAVAKAEEGFMRLPAEARAKFENSPAAFLEYAARVSEAELIDFCGLKPAPQVPVVAAPQAPQPSVGAAAPVANAVPGA